MNKKPMKTAAKKLATKKPATKKLAVKRISKPKKVMEVPEEGIRPQTVRVRIPNRFDSYTACWESDVVDTGDSEKNLGEAIKAAILSRANLSGADLSRANLSRADLSGADLSGANLSRANLSGANLSGANLSGANLSRANLSRAKNADLAVAKTRILPEGSLIGWKKLQGDIIAKLRIPETAKRSHAFGRKCRAEFAEVLELMYKDGSPAPSGNSQHDSSFVYKVGETVRPSNGFSEEWTEECAPGVHFFITKIEAENY